MILSGTSGRIVTAGKPVEFRSWEIAHDADGNLRWTATGLRRLPKKFLRVVFDAGKFCHTLTKTRLNGTGGSGGVLATFVHPPG